MPYSRTSAGQPAAKPKSHDNSLPKSNNASIKPPTQAERAAAQAFSAPKSLPFDPGNVSTGPAEEGRRRLSGAFLIPIDRIVPDPDQPRKKIDPVYLTGFTASVKRLGILSPISVRYVESKDNYRIIAGECRYTAAKEAGLTEIPCCVRNSKEESVLLEQIVENWQRSNLQPLELADSLARLRDANKLTQHELARQIGKSEGEVSKLLALLHLDPEVQKIARDDTSGRITKSHLYPLLQLHPAQQQSIVHAILERDLTVRETERMIARYLATHGSTVRRGAPVTRRKFVTKYGSALLTFRKTDVNDQDCLAVLKEAIDQIKERAGDPKDLV